MNGTYRSVLALGTILDYRDRPVSRDDLDRVVGAARWTGSGENIRKWGIVVVRTRACGDYAGSHTQATETAFMPARTPG